MIAKTKSSVSGAYHVSLEEAKAHLRLDEDFTRDDSQLRDVIKAAGEIAEDEIQKDIIKTANVLSRSKYCGTSVKVNQGNLIDITAVVADGDALTDYVIYVYKDYFTIEFDSYISTEDELVITFNTGFDIGQIPYSIKRALYIKIGDLYDIDRSSSTFANVKDTGTFERILAPHKAAYVDAAREN